MTESIEFKGMEEFMAKLNAISDEYADTAEKHLNHAGNKLKKMAKEATPVGKDEYIMRNGKKVVNKRKHMANRWRSKIVGLSGTDLEYQLRNTSPNFHLVERGHVKKTPGGKGIGFVKGQHFFQNAMNNFQASGTVEKELEKFAKDIKKKIDG